MTRFSNVTYRFQKKNIRHERKQVMQSHKCYIILFSKLVWITWESIFHPVVEINFFDKFCSSCDNFFWLRFNTALICCNFLISGLSIFGEELFFVTKQFFNHSLLHKQKLNQKESMRFYLLFLNWNFIAK